MASQSPVEQRPPAPPAAEPDAQHFAYIASHDLNAPLRAISGFVELLMAEYGDRLDEQGRDWMQRAVDSTRKMQGMLDDLRVYSRLKPTNVRQAVALPAVLADVELELGAKIRELGAGIGHEDLPTVPGDLAQITMLVRHVVDNALQYRCAEPPRVHVGAEDRGDRWLISVADNGLGIEPKHHARIFEMFKRLQQAPAYPGSGVGLTLARRIVQLHGGEMWVESELGAGARFLFTLLKGNPA
jgi:light-regulated signal transduction histidine kinase (bacteriophytochrome)